jgi:hypothetical protein
MKESATNNELALKQQWLHVSLNKYDSEPANIHFFEMALEIRAKKV